MRQIRTSTTKKDSLSNNGLEIISKVENSSLKIKIGIAKIYITKPNGKSFISPPTLI